jgi:hypothetical protein
MGILMESAVNDGIGIDFGTLDHVFDFLGHTPPFGSFCDGLGTLDIDNKHFERRRYHLGLVPKAVLVTRPRNDVV